MKILAIDCADKSASCAVIADSKIIASSFISSGLTHSRTLMPAVNAMLENSEQKLSDIDCFAVTVGPGSFTGLRIGIAAVKGMAYGANKPCVGVSTLECAALGATQADGIICAAMDARCNQVYNALFRCEGGALTRLCEDRALMLEELKAEICKKYQNENIIFVGGGAELCHNKFGFGVLAPEHCRVARAEFMANAVNEADFITADQLQPSYLRLPQAERELNSKLKK